MTQRSVAIVKGFDILYEEYWIIPAISYLIYLHFQSISIFFETSLNDTSLFDSNCTVDFYLKKKDVDTCEYDMCDSRRKTITVADNWTGTPGYYNDLRKWGINISIPNTIDGIRTWILCKDIPDSPKTLVRFITFSGDLKESCNNPIPVLRIQKVYFVNPIKLK